MLTESVDPGACWRKLKHRLAAEGKRRITDCANTEGLFRIIQSIPAHRAEPFKRWLAQVGDERVKEIEIPELARACELYQAKGYPKDWIEKRLRSIAVRGGRGQGIRHPHHGNRPPQGCPGLDDNRDAAKQGGAAAGNAGKELESKSGKPGQPAELPGSEAKKR